MIGNTESGGIITVYTDKPYGGLVMIGIRPDGADKKNFKIGSQPLNPKEARILANWLNGAADEAEKYEVEQNAS